MSVISSSTPMEVSKGVAARSREDAERGSGSFASACHRCY